MKTRHITLPVNPERLQNDERLRSAFIEMFGSEAFNKAVDPDSPDGTFDYTDQEVKNMSDEEFAQNRHKILESMSKGRIAKS